MRISDWSADVCSSDLVADLWALEKSRLFPGRFHVLGGRLAALEGIRPEDLSIDTLTSRVAAGGIDEVVLAMNATRSEERRVGKEWVRKCRSRWSAYHTKKNKKHVSTFATQYLY